MSNKIHERTASPFRAKHEADASVRLNQISATLIDLFECCIGLPHYEDSKPDRELQAAWSGATTSMAKALADEQDRGETALHDTVQQLLGWYHGDCIFVRIAITDAVIGAFAETEKDADLLHQGLAMLTCWARRDDGHPDPDLVAAQTELRNLADDVVRMSERVTSGKLTLTNRVVNELGYGERGAYGEAYLQLMMYDDAYPAISDLFDTIRHYAKRELPALYRQIENAGMACVVDRELDAQALRVGWEAAQLYYSDGSDWNCRISDLTRDLGVFVHYDHTFFQRATESLGWDEAESKKLTGNELLAQYPWLGSSLQCVYPDSAYGRFMLAVDYQHRTGTITPQLSEAFDQLLLNLIVNGAGTFLTDPEAMPAGFGSYDYTVRYTDELGHGTAA